jgi:type IV pilus assembly protein PilW
MNKKDTAKGFTLIELMIAMSIGLIVLMTTYDLLTSQKRHFNMQEQKAEMLQNARSGMLLMTTEMLMAGYDPVNTPKLGGIVTAAADRIRFTANLTRTNTTTTAHDSPDEDILDPGEDITYYIETLATGTKQLVRVARMRLNPSSASDFMTIPVADNISALSFTYLDASNNITTNPALMKKIRVSITAQTDKPDTNHTYPTITLSSDIEPRNLNN